MVLSSELLQYAENIWHRFPEEFIALGSPNLEDHFMANSWRRRVTDTTSEKVIEIFLPRRGCQTIHSDVCASGDEASTLSHDSTDQSEYDTEEDESDEGENGQEKDQDRNKREPKTRGCHVLGYQQVSDDQPSTMKQEMVTSELDRLNRAVEQLASSLSNAVAKEVQQQLQDDSSPLFQRHEVGENNEQCVDVLASKPNGDVSPLAIRREFPISPVTTREFAERRRAEALAAIVRRSDLDKDVCGVLWTVHADCTNAAISSCLPSPSSSPRSSQSGLKRPPRLGFHGVENNDDSPESRWESRGRPDTSPSSQGGFADEEPTSPGALLELLAKKKRTEMRRRSNGDLPIEVEFRRNSFEQ